MNDREAIRRAASQLRSGDTVQVNVIYAGGQYRVSKYNWKVELSCNRPAWKHAGFKGGRSSRFFIGHCRTQESAAKRANNALKLLNAERA